MSDYLQYWRHGQEAWAYSGGVHGLWGIPLADATSDELPLAWTFPEIPLYGRTYCTEVQT